MGGGVLVEVLFLPDIGKFFQQYGILLGYGFCKATAFLG